MLKNRFKKLLIISITAVLLYGCYSMYVQTREKSPVRYAQIDADSPFANVQTNTDFLNTYFQKKVIAVKQKMYRDGVLLWETEYDKAGKEIKAVRYKSDGSIDKWEEYECSADGKTTAWISHYRDGSISSRGESKYDEAGHLIESVEYNHSGEITVKSTYVYDEAGNEIEEVQYFGDDIYRRYEYEYEEDGRKKKYIEYNGDGDIFSYKECEYDEAGHELSELTYGTDGIYRRSEQKYDKNGNEIRFTYIVDGEITMQLEYSRDEWGNVTEERSLAEEWPVNTYEYEYETIYVPSRQYAQAVVANKKEYHDGELTRETEYDQAGNETKRTWYKSDGSIHIQEKFTYDNLGNLIVYEEDTSGGSNYKETYEYDEEGNVMKDVTNGYDTANADSSMGSWHYSYEYQYDKAGNMEKRISYITDDEYFMSEWEYDEKGRLLTEIEYYDDGVSVRTKDEYEYDSAGKRIKRIRTEYEKTEKEITDFYYDEWGNLIEERTGAESNTYEYEYEYE